MIGKSTRHNIAAFTLLESVLTLFILSLLLIIGSHYTQPSTTILNEQLAVNRFKRTWDSAVNYSATHKTSVEITTYSETNTLIFRTIDNTTWYREIEFPETIRFGSNVSEPKIIYDGKTKNPMIIVFRGANNHDYRFTANLYWGRLYQTKD